VLVLPALLVVTSPGVAVAGAAKRATLTAYTPTSTAFTGIDPGAGLFYSYAPSIVQTSPDTRYVFYCGNAQSGVVRDHVHLSVGHLRDGRWQYGRTTIVLAPAPDTYYSIHTCEPQVIGGSFHFGGKPYKWAIFFTAESKATNSTNQIGLAFSNSLSGPYKIDSTPIVQTSDVFGKNSYPNDCPLYPTGQTFYCLGEPAATTIGDGHIALMYMGNSGSPGNDSHPVEGQVLSELDLSNVPATGPCPACFLTLPNGGKVEAVSTSGVDQYWFHDASIAYDPPRREMVISYDNGPPDTTPDPPPVTPVITVATLPVSDFLRGTGTWRIQGNFGQCLSGYTDNHNSGIVQTPNGDVPPGGRLTVMYTVADDNLRVDWGVWDYRIWSVTAPLTSAPLPTGSSVATASTSCPGLDVLETGGTVTTGGSARDYPPASAERPGAPVVGMALTPDRHGYYLVTQKGQTLTFGDAHSRGSVPAGAGNVIGIALDVTTGGYWIARANGTVYGFDAPRLGSFATTASSGPVVAIAAIPNGQGYYLVTANGDVSAYGLALTYGNFTVPSGQTVAAIAPTPNGLGYYLVTKQGTIAAFGDAQLYGPAVVQTSSPIAAMAVSTNGFGYWTISSSGTVVAAGNASAGLVNVAPGSKPVVAMVSS